MRQSIISKLMDSYNKNPDSNIAKLISILADQIENLKNGFERVEDWRDVDVAEGAELDRIGYDIGQPRGQTSDEIYRILIKSKRARDLSTGDINTIINAISMSINADPKDLKIEELWNDEIDKEPGAIRITQLPIDKLNEVGLTANQFGKLVATTLAGGTAVKQIDLTGTFEFGGTESVLDDEKGFSNIEQEIGGYFGAVYSPANESDLPI